MTTCLTVDLGLVKYAEAYALQRRIVAARKADAIADVLLLCEHPHVITQGRNGKREHLLASETVLRQKGVDFHETSRGGDGSLAAVPHGGGVLVLELVQRGRRFQRHQQFHRLGQWQELQDDVHPGRRR